MDENSQLISGLKLKQTLPPKERRFSLQEKHFIINEYLRGFHNKQYYWELYTGYTEEHGQLTRWMRNLGYDTTKKPKIRPKFEENINPERMKKKENNEPDFEKLQLEKRIQELEKQLKDADMKAIAFSTMIDIAEKELNINIRKKYNTKPSNK